MTDYILPDDPDYVSQTDLLRTQLAALDAGPRVRYRKFRALEWICDTCGKTIVEVLRTSPYRVIRMRDVEDHPDTPPAHLVDETLTGIERGRALAQADPSNARIRAGEWRFLPISHHFETDRSESHGRRLPVACECTNWGLIDLAQLAEDLRSATTRRVLRRSREDTP